MLPRSIQQLGLVIQGFTFRRENLEPIIFRRIMTSSNHYPRRKLPSTRLIRQNRRRNNVIIENIRTRLHRGCNEHGTQNRARQSSIMRHRNLVPYIRRDSPTQLCCQGWRDNLRILVSDPRTSEMKFQLCVQLILTRHLESPQPSTLPPQPPQQGPPSLQPSTVPKAASTF